MAFRTCEVGVIAPLEPATDAHGNRAASLGAEETVGGVLPQPGATSDLDASRPAGATVAMTFHWPRADARSLKGCLVRYGGRAYRVIGDPQPYPSCPGPFARAVECEACDG